MKILILFLFPVFLFAHALSVNTLYESGELYIESMYGNGDACKGCEFVVTHKENEIFKGTLDNDGVFEQAVSLKTPFVVYIDGGMGHKAKVSIDGSEIEQEETNTTVNTPSDITNSSLSGIDEERLKKIIRSELNKQNAKIETIVDKHKSKLEQILVGLGYILGLFGLWQLFARRYQK